MANWDVLKSAIAGIIKTNGNQEITGQLLQNVLNNIVSSVGENANFAGIAIPTTNPGAPDGPVFYLAATAGSYSNFGSIKLVEGEAVILEWDNGAWAKKVSGFSTQEQLKILSRSKIIPFKVWSSQGSDYSTLKTGEFGCNTYSGFPCEKQANGALLNMDWDESVLYEYKGRLFKWNGEKLICQKNVVRIEARSGVGSELMALQQGAFCINLYSGGVVEMRVTDGLARMHFEKETLFLYEDKYYQLDAEQNQLIEVKFFTELESAIAKNLLEIISISAETRVTEIANKGDLTVNKIIKNGQEVDHESPWCTELIPYSPRNKYVYTGNLGSYSLNAAAYYDGAKNLIGTSEVMSGQVYSIELLNIPANTAFIRFCSLNIESTKFEVTASSYYTELESTLNKLTAENSEERTRISALEYIDSFITLPYEGEAIGSTQEDGYSNVLINPDTGKETSYDNARASEYIEIEAGKPYFIYASMAFAWALYAFYDADKNFLSGKPSADSKNPVILNGEIIVAPEKAAFIRVCTYSAFQAGIVRPALYQIKSEVGPTKKWAGKKWVCMGDSLTEFNLRATKHYHDYVADVTGIEVVNMGRSGTGYKRTEDEGFAFYQRIQNVPEDADVITIFGSGNDNPFFSTTLLGTATDTGTETVGGCINTTIDNLYGKMPLAVLGIISPTPWIGLTPDKTQSGMTAYCKLLQEICYLRGIPFLDLFHCSGLRPDDATFRELAYSRDEGNGVHPDEIGHKLIAPRFEAFLDTLLMH